MNAAVMKLIKSCHKRMGDSAARNSFASLRESLQLAEDAMAARKPLVAMFHISQVALALEGRYPIPQLLLDLEENYVRDLTRPSQRRLRTVDAFFIYEFECAGCERIVLTLVKDGWVPEAMLASDDISIVMPINGGDRLSDAGCPVFLDGGVCENFDPKQLDFTIRFAPTIVGPDVAEDALSFVAGVMKENGWIVHADTADYEAKWLLHREGNCCEAEGEHVGPFHPVDEDDEDAEDEDDEDEDDETKPPKQKGFSNN